MMRILIVFPFLALFLIVGAMLDNRHVHQQAVVVDEREIKDLALNIYHETRGVSGQGNVGWRSVAAVVFNRLEDERFPKTIHKVIFQRNVKKGTCAFSWYCDEKSDRVTDAKTYNKILAEARQYLVEYRSGVWVDPTHGAHSYHATTIKPNKYFQRLQLVLVVDDGEHGHRFYRDGS